MRERRVLSDSDSVGEARGSCKGAGFGELTFSGGDAFWQGSNTDFRQGLDVLRHDMTQYYTKRPLRPSSL